jgi:DNA repair exonuclease SbcCD ATPase subunit
MSTTAEKEANRLRQQRYLENHRDEVNEYRRERYAARKDAGKCPRCGKKLRSAKFVLCKKCLEQAKGYNAV